MNSEIKNIYEQCKNCLQNITELIKKAQLNGKKEEFKKRIGVK